MKLDLCTVNPSIEQHGFVNTRRSDPWVCPPQGFCKINWDVAVDKHLYKIGIEVAVRDDMGNFLATLRKNLSSLPDPNLAEAIAAGIAAKFGVDLGMRRIILEGDSKKVVTELNLKKHNRSYFGMIIRDVQDTIAKMQACRVTHVHREGNYVAHNLAKAALYVTDYVVNMEETPLFHHIL
ncbi:uncharacterized protein LOC121253462 [Juglans microcarpa x Juglans regia]|uniref:uncharacterized protein LOC121253462 n=1 Tax=Juglans microcarpa x Juglans regia TaxID=2249226 RepID=UPI001B7F22BA|nr:uncharacterized protein LOC121253462 [Juglans microcarpa x Juglans regia]